MSTYQPVSGGSEGAGPVSRVDVPGPGPVPYYGSPTETNPLNLTPEEQEYVSRQPVSGTPSSGTEPTRTDPTQEVTPTDLDPMQVLLFRTIGERLQSMGLGGLFTWQGNVPGGWLWDTIVEGDFTTPEEVQILLEGRPEFQNRFPALFELRRAAAAGQNVQVLTPAEIIALELQMGEIGRMYNMPKEMFDNPVTDLQPYIARGMSMRQFDQRIRISYNRVANLDPAIKDYFKAQWGVPDDRMLAAFYLDPDKFESRLDLFSRAGAIGGIGARYGIAVSRQTAEDLAAAGFDENVRSQMGRIAESDLYRETISEGATDLRAGEEGLRAELGTDTGAIQAVSQRRQTRAAAFQGGGGAARVEQGYGVGEAG